jgi:hypothetical protein
MSVGMIISELVDREAMRELGTRLNLRLSDSRNLNNVSFASKNERRNILHLTMGFLFDECHGS